MMTIYKVKNPVRQITKHLCILFRHGNKISLPECDVIDMCQRCRLVTKKSMTANSKEEVDERGIFRLNLKWSLGFVKWETF